MLAAVTDNLWISVVQPVEGSFCSPTVQSGDPDWWTAFLHMVIQGPRLYQSVTSLFPWLHRPPTWLAVGE